MKSATRFLFAAVHKGPYLSIQPLEKELGADRVSYIVAGVSRDERGKKGLPYRDMDHIMKGWGSLERFLCDLGVKTVIRGSSEDVEEINVEVSASESAAELGIPVFVIEDFPGNYWPRQGERIAGLFVEDDSLIAIHQSRGIDPDVIYATGNPRYNELMHLDTGSLRDETRRTLGLKDETVMLWAGQPDGDNSYVALNRLLDNYRDPRVTLLFRAHPRDKTYVNGRYAGLLAGSPMLVHDVSSYPDALGLYCASDLVTTQFSSAGVEASYLGVPALFVLFDDLGKEYLRSFKGYDCLPWCNTSCSFSLESGDDIGDVMNRALFDTAARRQVQANFRHHFGDRADSGVAIADRIRAGGGEAAGSEKPGYGSG